MKGHIIFFDGDCSFCNSIVFFIIKQDKNSLFKYAPLRGRAAVQLLPTDIDQGSTLALYLPSGRVLTRSRAVFSICYLLGGAWRLLSLFKYLPRFITDGIYSLVARSRHYLAPKKCYSISDDKKELFLE